MSTMSRRTLFALPIAAPTVAAVAALPIPARAKVAPYPFRKTADVSMERRSRLPGHHWHVLWRHPSPKDLAATLGIPYHGETATAFTDAKLAATLGIDAGGLDDKIVAVSAA